MSIFTPIPKCEVCRHRECEATHKANAKGEVVLSGYKKRCSYCKDRFDQHGEPFIIYCDQYKYEKVGGISHRPMALWLWLMGGKVMKITGTSLLDDLRGMTWFEANVYLELRGWEFQYKNDAVI